MEFNFNINNLLGETITRLDCNLTPARRNAEGYDLPGLRSLLMSVIDKMGEASSRAQGLPTIITTGRKLQLSEHILYVMKDATANGGRGAVVGILKLGSKRLFVYSHHGNVHEMEPQCVLDFYVHESRQRMGCGRKLFDAMLQDQGVKPHHLAIDKPSFKFSQFLNKHYNLRAELPQVNNFVVFEGFFNNRPDVSGGRRRSGLGKPPAHPVKRRDQYVSDATSNGYTYPRLPQSNSRPPSGNSQSNSVLSTPRGEIPDYPKRNVKLRPISASNGEEEERVEKRTVSAQSVKSEGQRLFSRHAVSQSPQGSRPGSRPSSGTQINFGMPPEPPPLLKRGVTTDGYLQSFNLHQDYQGRRGHMKVGSATQSPIRNPYEETAINPAWQPPMEQANWTVFNKPPGYLSIAQRNYTHTRLW